MAINEDIFIKEKLIDLNIDGNEGTAMYDLVVSPLAQILEKFKNDNNLNINKFSRFSESDLIDSDVDFIGNQYLLIRNPGSRASGFVKFYFTSRVSVNITKDSVITNNNKRFKIVNNYSFPASSLNYGPPYYYTNDIQIEALTASEDYNLAKNSPFKIEGYVSNSPAKILNTTELFGGIKSETNSQYLTRIKNSIFGSFLSSPITIENTLKSSFPSIQSVDIISNEHPLMLRDIIYDLSVTSAYNKEDFSFVNTATPNLGYDKMHRAYYGEFKDTNTGVGVGFPTSPLAWSTQFSNSDYKNISLNSDILYKSTSRVSILNGFLTINNYSDTTSLINNGWVLKDGTSIDSELIRPTDITLLSGNLILGKSLYTERTFNVQVGVFDSLLDHIATLGSVPEIQELVTKTKLELTASNANNSSPVALKQIDQHKGIVIKVTMNTNDLSEIGSSSYVTVLKNNLVYSPYDGYGIAWRKQPAYLIRKNQAPRQPRR